jgi:hypothetical protein
MGRERPVNLFGQQVRVAEMQSEGGAEAQYTVLWPAAR